MLRESNTTICFAESCTGGIISGFLTDLPGISKFFWGSLIVYSNEAKIKLLGVQAYTLEYYGAVSEETVMEMCKGALEVSETGISIGVTGIAGPDGETEGKPVGTVWVGVLGNNNCSFTQRFEFEGCRDNVRRSAMYAALLMLESFILKINILDIETVKEYI